MSGAVFLSYAREDTAAALRIAEALRSHGVEVWFDQSELQGGDAWDAKIRNQVRECALFIPIISARTQERHEGYFRLEWKLAVDRTHLMLEGVPFLAPVVIDDTPDSGAAVPGEFLRVQWTRLPGALPTPQYVDQVRGLLEAPRKRTIGGGGAGPRVPAPTGSFTHRKSGLPAWAWGALGAAAVAIIAFFFVPKREEPSAAAQAPANSAGAEAAPPAIPKDKSIAVLAFENFGGDKENEYFSDGITEELLNALAKVPGLRVAARTSSFYFKGKDATIAEIAHTLNVAYVVEGSVQSSGNRVKVTAQLISAADGFHLWSDTFTREQEDIFTMEDDIAGVIAQNLQLNLGNTARVAKTVDPEAHRYLLEGRYNYDQRTREGFTRGEADFDKALEIDPQYAEAHAGLGELCVIRALYGTLDGSSKQDDAQHGRDEAQEAIRIDPSLAGGYFVLGYASFLAGDLKKSDLEFQQALALDPSSRALGGSAQLAATEGRLDASLEARKRESEFDPLWWLNLANYSEDLNGAHRFAAALEVNERATSLHSVAYPLLLAERAESLWFLGRKQEAVAAARELGRDLDAWPRRYFDGKAIWVLERAGQGTEAEVQATRVLGKLPADSAARGFVLLGLGRFDEALPFLERTPTLALRELFYNPMWDPFRDDPRFAQLMVKLGCADDYKVARETLGRLLQEQDATK